MKRLPLSGREQEQVFQFELIKVGIDRQRAARVAQLLSQALATDSLTPEDQQLIQEVCQQWFSQRKRLDLIRYEANRAKDLRPDRATSNRWSRASYPEVELESALQEEGMAEEVR